MNDRYYTVEDPVEIIITNPSLMTDSDSAFRLAIDTKIKGLRLKQTKEPMGTWRDYWTARIRSISPSNRLPRGFKEPYVSKVLTLHSQELIDRDLLRCVFRDAVVI